MDDVATVGGKNASLGELISKLSSLGIRVPAGFATTADAYREFLRHNQLDEQLADLLAGLDPSDVSELSTCSRRIRDLILGGSLPDDFALEIAAAYEELCSNGHTTYVAVRSSATAEDLPTASFAGQQESFLYISGVPELNATVVRCFASLFTARAISYRAQRGFDHLSIALSVGIQRMVRSDRASAGVIFTLDPDSGHRDVVLVTSSYGLGEGVVQGRVAPDEFYLHKPTLRNGYPSLLWSKPGTKETQLIWDDTGHRLRWVPVDAEARARRSLSDDDVLELARWSIAIEDHYSAVRGQPTPMDIEWAKDGVTGELFIVQARPETVHSQRSSTVVRTYELLESGDVLAEGQAVGDSIGTGTAHFIATPEHSAEFKPGEVLIATATDPDWEPVMKVAAAIVTERGGRTSHAAIVAREIGVPALVGASGAISQVNTGDAVTVSCAEGERGRVYAGALQYDVHEVDLSALPQTRTQIMVNLAHPDKAFHVAQLPNDGVGLARMEFVFSGWVGIHPMAIVHPNKVSASVRREIDERASGYDSPEDYFVHRLAEGIAVLAAAFYPKRVILRLSDFKSNEYAHLIGGEVFEPHEHNPMIGWRGASRYYHPKFEEGFLLEIAAIKRVREDLGLDNLTLMVPFCRTPQEGARVLATMKKGGLERGKNGLEVYVMAEIPSNILVADQFAEIFDGFSIGSNDLTQLVLGIDRDSELCAPLFDERHDAVKRACSMLIQTAHECGRKVGICGQAPSDYPEFAEFLVREGIDSLSLSPDALVKTRLLVAEVESKLERLKLDNPIGK